MTPSKREQLENLRHRYKNSDMTLFQYLDEIEALYSQECRDSEKLKKIKENWDKHLNNCLDMPGFIVRLEVILYGKDQPQDPAIQAIEETRNDKYLNGMYLSSAIDAVLETFRNNLSRIRKQQGE